MLLKKLAEIVVRELFPARNSCNALFPLRSVAGNCVIRLLWTQTSVSAFRLVKSVLGRALRLFVCIWRVFNAERPENIVEGIDAM